MTTSFNIFLTIFLYGIGSGFLASAIFFLLEYYAERFMRIIYIMIIVLFLSTLFSFLMNTNFSLVLASISGGAISGMLISLLIGHDRTEYSPKVTKCVCFALGLGVLVSIVSAIFFSRLFVSIPTETAPHPEIPELKRGAIWPELDTLFARLYQIEREIRERKATGDKALTPEVRTQVFTLFFKAVETFLPNAANPKRLADQLTGAFFNGLSKSAGENTGDMIFDWLKGYLNEEEKLMEVSKWIIRFDFGSDEVPTSGLLLLQHLALKKLRHATTVTIVGFADRVGTKESNYRLAERRADNVKQIFQSIGIHALNIFAFASNELCVPIVTPDGLREPENRRVEITFQ